MATQEEMSRYFWSASTNCPPVTDKPKERHPNIEISQTYISRERQGRVNSGKTKGRQE
jgi:hypothetical protein